MKGDGSTSGILVFIKRIFNSLTKSEQKVALSISNDNEKVIYCSISDFADTLRSGMPLFSDFAGKSGSKAINPSSPNLLRKLPMPTKALQI